MTEIMNRNAFIETHCFGDICIAVNDVLNVLLALLGGDGGQLG